MSLEFKTHSEEGILFYGWSQYPQYNHLAISLHNSSLHVSVVFVDTDSYNELWTTIGGKLNDDR